MKSQRFQLGLVAEGNSAQSTLFTLTKLVEHLGPIKAPSLSAGRRLRNALGHGTAVTDYEGLADASLLLIRVPDQTVPQVVSDLLSSSLDLAGLAVVLCESWLPLGSLSPLASRGAEVATLFNLPVAVNDWFAIEGHARTVRTVRKMLERSNVRCDELSEGGKPLVFTSHLLVQALAPALYQAAQTCLRSSGFAGNTLNAVLDKMLQQAIRDFLRSAATKSRNWEWPAQMEGSSSALLLQELRMANPRLAEHIQQLSLLLESTPV